MNTKLMNLFLPCAAGVQEYLAQEVRGLAGSDLRATVEPVHSGVRVRADWPLLMRLNLLSRLAHRVLIELVHVPCLDEQDIYERSLRVDWSQWFSAQQSFRIDITARSSPLKSLKFAALRIKDAVADSFRAKTGQRPDVNTRKPDVRIHAHLSARHMTLYIDSTGEALFKRGWRQDKGDAPLKETLAAAMLAASGWWQPESRQVSPLPLYDPCCGSGTIVIEAAQLALSLPAGGQRRFGFERLLQHDPGLWQKIRAQSRPRPQPQTELRIFGSDVAHRMVDFAQRNAERAGVARALQLRGGDALQRQAPAPQAGVILMNPPYGQRIDVAGFAGPAARQGRENFISSRASGEQRQQKARSGGVADDFFIQLAAHWKSHFAGWTAWVLTPDPGLPGQLRLKASRRVPLWNGPIECRLMRFELQARRKAP